MTREEIEAEVLRTATAVGRIVLEIEGSDFPLCETRLGKAVLEYGKAKREQGYSRAIEEAKR